MNLVVRLDGHILHRIAERLAGVLNCSFGNLIHPADTNVYFPYYLAPGDFNTVRDVAIFTHREDPTKGEGAARKAAKFDEVAESCYRCIAMSRRTAEHLPPKKTVVIEPPADPIYQKNKLVLGLCGLDQPFGRKDFTVADELAAIPGVEVRRAAGNIPQALMPDWYRALDYLVVSAVNEGGPMPVKEAIAVGTPVIAPDVGWCWDHPVIAYVGLPGLLQIVRGLAPKPDAWVKFATEIAAACE